jgi:hypothetical protein
MTLVQWAYNCVELIVSLIQARWLNFTESLW